jgi:hypothetical protein
MDIQGGKMPAKVIGQVEPKQMEVIKEQNIRTNQMLKMYGSYKNYYKAKREAKEQAEEHLTIEEIVKEAFQVILRSKI